MLSYGGMARPEENKNTDTYRCVCSCGLVALWKLFLQWFLPAALAIVVFYLGDDIYDKGGWGAFVPLMLLFACLPLIVGAVYRLNDLASKNTDEGAWFWLTLFLVSVPIVWPISIHYCVKANQPIPSVTNNVSLLSLTHATPSHFFTVNPTTFQRDKMGAYQSFSMLLAAGPATSDGAAVFYVTNAGDKCLFTQFSNLPVQRDGFVWLTVAPVEWQYAIYECEQDLRARFPALNYTTRQFVAPSDKWDNKLQLESVCTGLLRFRIAAAVIGPVVWTLPFLSLFVAVYTR